jgi:hypothetical protein
VRLDADVAQAENLTRTFLEQYYLDNITLNE